MRLRAWALALGILIPLNGPALPQEAAGGGGAAAGSGSGSGASGQDCGNEAFAKKLSGRESGGNQRIVNSSGYMGSYQMGEAALIQGGYASRNGNAYDNKNIAWTGKDGINSTEDFLSNQGAQTNAFNANLSNNWKTANRLNLTQYVGRDVGGTTLTESGILGGMHLKPAAVKAYFDNGGCISGKGSATNDGNGTCVGEYMKKFSGYDVSSITGKDGKGGSCANTDSKDDNKNQDSKTCKVHVPMVQAINCSEYVSSLQAFCFETKPKVMQMDECESAEKYAKGAPKGKREDECKKQTFGGKGTGSWSYVLACSGTPTDQGEKGKDNKDNKEDKDKAEGKATAKSRAELDKYKGQSLGESEQCVALSKELGTDENGRKLGAASGWKAGTTITADNWQQYEGQAVATSNDNGTYGRNGGSTASQVRAGNGFASHTGILSGWDERRNAPILFDQYAGATAQYRTANTGFYGNFSTIRQ
jgi:hypothetical protein